MSGSRFTDEARRILDLALREALQLGHNTINTEHILLAIVREGETLAAQALVNLGADQPKVRRAVIDLLVAALS